MKLMTLNIWGGHIRKPLLEFIASQQDIDIFCLQEVYHNAHTKMATDEREYCFNIFSQIHECLPNFNPYFKPVMDIGYGIGMFVKNGINVIREGEINIHDNPTYSGRGPTHPRIMQWLELERNGQHYTIMNVHGLWNGMGKTDSPDRIVQSQNIKTFIDNTDTAKILCGDFNLRPDTESIKILESGMNNLIKEYDIQSTRTNLYPKEEKFADYVLTCPNVTVNDFAVLNDEVSDHSPLVLEFS